MIDELALAQARVFCKINNAADKKAAMFKALRDESDRFSRNELIELVKFGQQTVENQRV